MKEKDTYEEFTDKLFAHLYSDFSDYKEILKFQISINEDLEQFLISEIKNHLNKLSEIDAIIAKFLLDYEKGGAFYNHTDKNTEDYLENFISFLKTNYPEEELKIDNPIIEYLIQKINSYANLKLVRSFYKDLASGKIKHDNFRITTGKINKFPEYCAIGVLILIEEDIQKVGFDFFYKEMKFESASSLEKYLKSNEILKTKSIRQYITDTFNGGEKDLRIPSRLKKIYDYCIFYGINIPKEVFTKYPTLNNLHKN